MNKKILIILSSVSFTILSSNVYADETEQLQLGSKLYGDNCARCHVLHNPDSFDKNEWKTITNRMFPKTKLNKNEQSLVLNYLLTNSKK